MAPKKPFNDRVYGPTYQPKGSGNTSGNVPDGLKEGDDLPPDGPGATRETLGDYLSSETKVNHYNVSPGSKEPPSHRDASGSPPIFTAFKDGGMPQGAGADKTFFDEALESSGADDPGGLQAHHLTSIGKSTYKNPDIVGGHINMASVEKDIGVAEYNKGVGVHRGTGHTLYTGIAQHPKEQTGKFVGAPTGQEIKPGPHPIQKRTSKILENNRFHPVKGSPYVKEGEFSSGGRGSMGTVQKILGAYDPTAPSIDIDKLIDIGRDIMVAGTGHAAIGADAAALMPSLQQMGVPWVNVDVSSLDPSTIANIGNDRSDILNPGGTSNKGEGFYQNEITSDTSYGHLNSHLEPFSGALPMGMIMVALAGLLVLIVQAAAIFLIILLLDNPLFAMATEGRQPQIPITMPKGKAQYGPGYGMTAAILNMLGVPMLTSGSGYLFSIMRGVGTFYGVSDLYIVPTPADFGDMMNSLQTSGGFVASLMRQGTRDLEGVVNIAMQLSGSKGVIAVAGSIIALLKELGNNRSMRFLMVCATLGDRMFSIDQYNISPVKMDLDRLQNSASTRLAKSRGAAKGGINRGMELVWSHRNLPRTFLLPASFATATAQYGLSAGQGAVAIAPMADKFIAADPLNPGRISATDLKSIEDALELEYVPFYFHDLRTNEVVAFHAFISDISEDYSPEFQTTSGYGRIDPVQIYKTTTRSISLSFIVAATNPDDFDEMWYTINKLVTMIYPQWTGGTGMKSGDDATKFIMPFSQIPGASPLIRLRVGDVIKSNYSRFNLARIFGVDQPSKADSAFMITGLADGTDAGAKMTKDLVTESGEAGKSRAREFATSNMGTPEPKTKFSKDFILAMLKREPENLADNKNGFPDLATAILMPNNEGIGYPKAGIQWNPTESAYVKITSPVVVKLPEGGGLFGIRKALHYPGVLALSKGSSPPSYVVKFADKAEGDGYDGDFYVKHQNLRVDPAWLAAELKKTYGGVEIDKKPVDLMPETAAFFDPAKNAVVRTMESSGGRGLAGVINNLSFDYNDAPWDTRALGSRAPMWMKVSMGFSPIHDIPPGLDADGMNRAPIYPVGRIVNGMIGPDIHGTNIQAADDELVKTYRWDRAKLMEVESKGDADGYPSWSSATAAVGSVLGMGKGDGASKP